MSSACGERTDEIFDRWSNIVKLPHHVMLCLLIDAATETGLFGATVKILAFQRKKQLNEFKIYMAEDSRKLAYVQLL